MKSEYNNTEVISMTEKEKLFLLIGRLSSDEVTALSKIVSSMVYSRFPAEDEELSEEEQKELDAAIKAYKKGEFEEGESLDEIFN